MDPQQLKLLGPVTSFLGSLIAFLTALRSGPGKSAAVLSATLGLVGSAAWLTVAYQDHLENAAEVELA